MSSRYHIINPADFSAEQVAKDEFALDVLMGLSSADKHLPTKYFYDQTGSYLFQQIMDLPEYYLTTCESEILSAHKHDIAQAVCQEQLSVIELGAGDGRKTTILIEALAQTGTRFCYAPIDISESAIHGLTKSIKKQFPAVECRGMVGDYFHGIRWSNENHRGSRLVLFLGSTVGNFTGQQTQTFLRTLWNALSHGDHLLIGFDLKKDIDILLHAYNDSRGVTSRFNLNLLDRINRELGGEFDVSKFQHFGTYDVISGAMKSYLVSREHQNVRIRSLNKDFSFQPYEAIHLEYSFKFLAEDVKALANTTGFQIVDHYFDKRRYFVDALWRVHKPSP